MTLGAKRLWTDRAVYFFTEPDPEGGTNRWILFWSHTDDFGFFGSDNEIETRFMGKIGELMKMEWQGFCKDYTSVEVSQDLERGIVELRQPTYWEQLGKQYSQYGVSRPSRLSHHYQMESRCQTLRPSCTKRLSTYHTESW